MNYQNISFNIIANAVWQYWGLSGGDNIFINLGKYLKKKGFQVNVFTWKHGYLMAAQNGLKDVKYIMSDAGKFERWPFALLYAIRTWLGIKKVREVVKKVSFNKKRSTIIYSASDFIPDCLPALVFKKMVPSALWIAGFYLFAPNPFKNLRDYFRHKTRLPGFSAFFYWASQKFLFKIILKYADLICVTSESDGLRFTKAGRKREEIFVVKGGVDYLHLSKFQEEVEKEYDAVYVGRFHPQKGAVEMIDIWNLVVKKKKEAKLAIIGFGPMERIMKEKVEKYNLARNIIFFGIMRGDDRNIVLQKSKIILHPSIYDSGGMAPVLGLACGLPGLCFDLPVFETYYAKGFLRAKAGNLNDFADKIIQLLDDTKLYEEMKKEAIEEAKSWDWKRRVNDFINFVNRAMKHENIFG